MTKRADIISGALAVGIGAFFLYLVYNQPKSEEVIEEQKSEEQLDAEAKFNECFDAAKSAYETKLKSIIDDNIDSYLKSRRLLEERCISENECINQFAGLSSLNDKGKNYYDLTEIRRCIESNQKGYNDWVE